MSTIPNVGTVSGFIPVVHPDGASPPIGLLRRFTVDEFERLEEAGVFGPEERVELLNGIICMMTPIGDHHSFCVETLGDLIGPLLGKEFCKWSQQPSISPNDKPQPDIYVSRGDRRKYKDKRPTLSELVLVIEVADSSVQHDRTIKLPIYAAAGIPEYWILNIPDRKLEVYRKPIAATVKDPSKYEVLETYASEQSVDLVLEGNRLGAFTVHDALP